MSDDAEPGALTAEGLFRLVTDEVYADGVLEDREKQIMSTLARFLRLAPDRAKEISRESKAAYRAGTLEHAERLSPTRLYQRILVEVLADGEMDDLEAQLVVGMRQLLGIEEAEHAELLAVAAARQAGVPEEAPAPAPAPAPVPAPAPAPIPAPESLEDWEALPQKAAMAAQTRSKGLIDKVLRKLDELGPPPGAAAPAVARTLANLLIMSIPQGDTDTLREAARRLRELRPLATIAKVQEEALMAWGCYLEWVSQRVQQGQPPEQVGETVDEILALLCYTEPTKAAVESLAQSLGAAGFLLLVAGGDHQRIQALSKALRPLSAAHAQDPEVQFTIARVMVNACIMVPDSWPTRDACLQAMAGTMEELLSRAPDSPDLRDAQGRFERQTGRKLQAPGSGPPVPDAPVPPGGRTPVPSGWVDEVEGWPDPLRAARHGFATPSAAVDALEEAYWNLHRGGHDLDAYLQPLMALYILDTEMGRRQATYGRLARVLGRHLTERPDLARAGMIGTKLRHLVEDLGDSENSALEREARALGDVLRAAGGG